MQLFCICLLLARKSKMNDFQHSYNTMLSERGINTFSLEEKKTVTSSVVLLLRRHSANNRLCCENNENDLRVTGIDKYGFTTQVTCTICKQTMETTCYDAKWTYERIYEEEIEEKLKPGDHICWHRPKIIWHHAIVKTMDPQKMVIHYGSDFTVKEKAMSEVHCRSCWFCDALYRINYEDCYNADYIILRATKLLNERRYDLLVRNCEHFSRWCKTGSGSSIQVSNFWASLGKAAVTVGLRLIALIILILLQYSLESQEDQVRNRRQLERLETNLITLYIVIFTVAFMIYQLVTACARLAVRPGNVKHHDVENPPRCCSNCYDSCTKGDNCRGCCCCCCGALHLFYRAARRLRFWRHIQCSERTCCRRPCNFACGLFWRIFIRETLAAAFTLVVLLHEEQITDTHGETRKSPGARTATLITYSTLAHIGGYIAGALLGRLAEAICDRCRLLRASKIQSPETERHLG